MSFSASLSFLTLNIFDFISRTTCVMINYTLFFQVIVYAALFSTRARTGLTLESVANKNQQICKKEKGSEKVGGNGLLFTAPTLFHCLGCISAYMYMYID